MSSRPYGFDCLMHGRMGDRKSWELWVAYTIAIFGLPQTFSHACFDTMNYLPSMILATWASQVFYSDTNPFRCWYSKPASSAKASSSHYLSNFYSLLLPKSDTLVSAKPRTKHIAEKRNYKFILFFFKIKTHKRESLSASVAVCSARRSRERGVSTLTLIPNERVQNMIQHYPHHHTQHQIRCGCVAVSS